MKKLLRMAFAAWCIICGVVAWLALALLGFASTFTQYGFMSMITPFIGVTILICIINYTVQIIKG